MKIYVDLLFFINVFFDFILLLSVSLILRRNVKIIRLNKDNYKDYPTQMYQLGEQIKEENEAYQLIDCQANLIVSNTIEYLLKDLERIEKMIYDDFGTKF